MNPTPDDLKKLVAKYPGLKMADFARLCNRDRVTFWRYLSGKARMDQNTYTVLLNNLRKMK